ncbi:hypothetical protein FHS05_001649 [Microbacterium endophyticum]|nr:hypothetical protein [Microbacterium endophyticum]
MTSDVTGDVTCSRAGCREPAMWRIDWRNPRIHDADRRKTWVACSEHMPFLRDYLSNRAFPVEVDSLVKPAGEIA